jgi:hypothetical protein
MIDLLTRIGMPGLALFLAILVYIFFLSLRSKSTNLALFFLLSSKLMNPILDGFVFSQETKVFLGQLNTVTSYLLLALAVLELILSKKKDSWEISRVLVLMGMFVIGFSYVFWKIYAKSVFTASDFTFLATLIIFAFLRPNLSSLKYLPKLSFCLILILFVCALYRYQNPYFPYFQEEFGIEGPYYNFMWDVFGTTERFRGPYISPNHLGFNVVLICILSSVSKSKSRVLTLGMGFVILLLSGSRISLLAFTAHILYTGVKGNQSGRRKKNPVSQDHEGKSTNRRSFFFVRILPIIGIGFAGLIIDPTLNGRTGNYSQVLEQLRGNYIFGNGPTIRGSVNSAENTYITLFSYYGIVGLIAIGLLFYGIAMTYKKSTFTTNALLAGILIPLVITSLGEFILVGGAYDIGLLYILLILSIREPRGNLPRPQNEAN